MKTSPAQQTKARPPTHQEISERATKLWEGYEKPAGRDQAIWFEAERQLLGVDPEVEGRDGISVRADSFDKASTKEEAPKRLGKSKSSQNAASTAVLAAPADTATAAGTRGKR